jgi:sodium/bile acid cotransporter 7
MDVSQKIMERPPTEPGKIPKGCLAGGVRGFLIARQSRRRVGFGAFSSFERFTSAMLRPFMVSLRRFVDSFTIALVLTVLLATLAPCRGDVASAFEVITSGAIALLFFLHGAKLSREAIVAGATHWRLHAVVFFGTFVLFPILGLLLKPLTPVLLTPELYLGVLFLCVLPSTVQSSIAFTSIAGGNVPAAICSASASNVFAVFLTPILVSLFIAGRDAGLSMSGSFWGIVLQIFVPFVAGHLVRPWIGDWLEQRRRLTGLVDRGSILLVVYSAFSGAIVEGLWKQIPLTALAGVVLIDCVLLLIVMVTMWSLSSLFGFNRADRITILFCGSKKSLASGVPIANVLFTGSIVGPMILPLMLFHQIQLMVCAALAQRWAALRSFPHEDAVSERRSRSASAEH